MSAWAGNNEFKTVRRTRQDDSLVKPREKSDPVRSLLVRRDLELVEELKLGLGGHSVSLGSSDGCWK